MTRHKRRRLHGGSTSGQEQAEALQPPSFSLSCRVQDPFIMRPFWVLRGESLDAYLVALAAFQRGLAVRFHYEVTSVCARFAHLAHQGATGTLLSISDGRKTHYFRRAQGDRTSRKASRLMDHKPSTKALLLKHGIEVPPGIVADRHSLSQARAFCQQHSHQLFLIKPVAGTLGQDVHRELSAEQALKHLSTQEEPVLLEVFIRGQEYRVHVVNGRYIGAVARLPAGVSGDGQRTVRELIAASNRQRDSHPLYRDMSIALDATLMAELSLQALGVESVPARGQVVRLGRVPTMRAGGESPIHSHTLSLEARRVAVRVQQLLKVPNTGIDLLVCDADTPQERVVVLEANQCPFLTALVAPLKPAEGMGNQHAEALIDSYFPRSRQGPRWPAASFDFIALYQMLPSAVASSLGLPRIQPDWLHQRLALSSADRQSVDLDAVITAMRQNGALVQSLPRPEGKYLIDALGSPAVLAAAWAQWPCSTGERCDP